MDRLESNISTEFDLDLKWTVLNLIFSDSLPLHPFRFFLSSSSFAARAPCPSTHWVILCKGMLRKGIGRPNTLASFSRSVLPRSFYSSPRPADLPTLVVPSSRSFTSLGSAHGAVKFFHYSRPDFLPSSSENPIPAADDHSTLSAFYESRYLPSREDRIATLGNPLLSRLLEENSVDLLDALHTGDADTAWATFTSLSDSALEGGSDESLLLLMDSLWWCIAAHPEAVRAMSYADRDLKQNAVYQATVARLAHLLDYVHRHPRLAELGALQRPLHQHRLLYLLVVQLETATRAYFKRGKETRPRVELPRAPAGCLPMLLKLLQDLSDRKEPIDRSLALRMAYQLATHGLPLECLAFWKEQNQPLSDSSEDTQRPHAPLRLDARTADALLDAIALWPDREQARLGDQEESTSRQAKEGVVNLALEAIEIAMNDGIGLHKRPMSSWMRHASFRTLWALLPAEVTHVASQVEEPWAVTVPPQQESTDDIWLPPVVSESVRSVLCDLLAFEMARRGDARPALARCHFAKAMPQHEINPDVQAAAVRGLSSNIVSIVSRQGFAKTTDLVLVAEHLFELYFDPAFHSPSRYRPVSIMVIAMAEAVKGLIKVKGVRGDLDSRLQKWQQMMRRLSSSLLAQDPNLSRDLISRQAHASLLSLHAELQDYVFTKELWTKWARRELSFKIEDTTGERQSEVRLPLSKPNFSWFFMATLRREELADCYFAVTLYQDWLALHRSNQQEPLPSALAVPFLRRLAKDDQIHLIRRIMFDMKQSFASFNNQLARVFAEVFRNSDAFSANQTIKVVEDLIDLYQAHNEASQSEAEVNGHSNQRVYHLALEVFAIALTRRLTLPSREEPWDGAAEIRLTRLFQKFKQALRDQLATRYNVARKYDPVPRIGQEAVRQGFNSAMRIGLQWPSLELFQKGPAARFDVLMEGMELNEDLAPEIPASSKSARSSIMPSSPQARGEARRGAILTHCETLEESLDVAGDSETWTLKLLAWMLPGDEQMAEQRRQEALKVWRASLEAKFDFSRSAEVEPWAKLPSSSGGGSIDGGETTDKSEQIIPKMSTQRPTMTPVLIRPRTASRLMLNLASVGDFRNAYWVHNTWHRQAVKCRDIKPVEGASAGTTIGRQASKMSSPAQDSTIHNAFLESALLLTKLMQKQQGSSRETSDREREAGNDAEKLWSKIWQSSRQKPGSHLGKNREEYFEIIQDRVRKWHRRYVADQRRRGEEKASKEGLK